MDFGVIESIEVTKNLDTGENVRLAQVNILDDDTVTVELPFPEGDEFVPAVGDNVYFEELDQGWLVARCIQTVMPVDESLDTGERELFSRSGQDRSAKIKLGNNGVITLNEGDDNAVKFAKLEAGLNTCLNSLNQLIVLLAAHTHTSSAPGVPSGVPLNLPYDPLTLDVSDAKVDKVKL